MKHAIVKHMLRRLLVAAALTLPGGAFAQTDGEIEEQADEIRLDESYAYGEANFVPSDDLDEDILTQQALAEVTANINQLRQSAGKSTLSPQQLYPIVSSLTYTSRGRKCIFLYITLEKALAFQPSAIDNVDAGMFAAGSGSASGGGSPAGGGGAPVVPPAGVGVGEVAVVQTDSVATGSAAGVVSAPKPLGSQQLLEIVDEILAKDSWTLTRLGQLMWNYQMEEKVTEVGQGTSLDDVPANAFFGRFDEALRMQGFYGPYPDGVRLEMKTGEPLNPADFEGCNIVWFY